MICVSDQFPPGQNSPKADFEVFPDLGSGLEAANFDAGKQRADFLGGGGSEVKPATTKYLPDQKLNREKKGTERDNILRELDDILRGDEQIPPEFMDEHPGKSRHTSLAFNRANLSLKRGIGEYSMI